jgi:hypothetical protein
MAVTVRGVSKMLRSTGHASRRALWAAHKKRRSGFWVPRWTV